MIKTLKKKKKGFVLGGAENFVLIKGNKNNQNKNEVNK